MLLGPRPPEARLVVGRRRVGHAAHGGLALLPEAVEAGGRRLHTLDALGERERPQLQQGGAPRERFPGLLQEEDLRRPEQEKAAAFGAIGEQLHRVEEGGLFLDLVEDHEARAVVQPADGVRHQAQTLVRVVEREVNRRARTGRRQ